MATVLVAGPKAAQLVAPRLFRGGSSSATLAPAGRICLANWRQSDGEEVVVAALDRERVEIHCHGGLAAPEAICRDLVDAGCERIDWPAWNAIDSGDRTVRAALVALAHARTERTAMMLLDQYQGALVRELADIERLIDVGDWQAAHNRVAAINARRAIGAHLVEPWRVVLAGLPNVGKSSLINALVGYQRAIVYDAPGTTRDTVATSTALGGWPVELCDTAGLRDSGETIEAEGVRLAREAAGGADALVLVFSAQEEWSATGKGLLAEWPSAIVVYSKCDLGAPPADGRPAGIATSAVTRAGLEELERAIVARLVPNEPAAGAAIPLDAEQAALVETLLAAIERRSAEAARAALAPWLADAAGRA
ncbi:MAG TPA: GTPase [Pirellulales bacterium]|nr:GTPase [Pirellulales bacterium]